MMNFKKSLLCVTAGAALSLSAAAAETTLRVATWLPPTNPQNATVWPTWKKWVEEALKAELKWLLKTTQAIQKPFMMRLKTVFTM